MTFARKMPEFYITIARKILFPEFRGHVLPLPPVSCAYVGSSCDGNELVRFWGHRSKVKITFFRPR